MPPAADNHHHHAGHAMFADPTAEAIATLNPAWVVVAALLIVNSMAIRRCCVRPGGLFHRLVKQSIRRRNQRLQGQHDPPGIAIGDGIIQPCCNPMSASTTASTNSNGSNDTATKKTLLQYSGFCVFIMTAAVYLVLYLCILPPELHWYAIVVAVAILVANAADEGIQKWESQRQDVLDFRIQLRQSWMVKNASRQDDDSDSSQYHQHHHSAHHDLEKCG